jgi:hypothetical protein
LVRDPVIMAAARSLPGGIVSDGSRKYNTEYRRPTVGPKGVSVSIDTLLGVAIGLGLAAACGFRVFVPLLVMAGAARLGHFDPSPGFDWLATTPALVAFAVATAVEIAAIHVTWLDHLLDIVAAPAAVMAGVVTMAGALGDLSPLLRWSFALIAGGGTAGIFHGLNGLLRAGTAVTTAGFGNPVFATLETGGAFAIAATAVLVPVLGLLLAGVAVVVVWRAGRRGGRRLRRQDP